MVLNREQRPLLGGRAADDQQFYHSAKFIDNETDHFVSQTGRNERAQALTPYETVSWVRRTSPQVLATTVDSTLYLSLGMMVAFPAVVIAALGETSNKGNLHFNAVEASWYGSLLFICQPVGSLAAGVLLQPIGCKKWMIYLQIPLLWSWLMVYYATSTTTLFAATALSGFVIGLMEAPTIRYISETSHPSLRSTLQTYASMFIPLGCFSIYFIAGLTNWRNVALLCTSMPILSMVFLLLIPETPIWLISKGRMKEALRSLQCLRGWTTVETVKDEYRKLEFYSSALSEKTAILDDEKDLKQRDFKEAWQDLTKRETLVILAKCVILYILSTFSGRQAMGPYQLQIYVDMNLPLDPNTIAMLLALAAIVGTVPGIFLIDLTGKKPLGIFGFTMNAICLCLLGVYTKLPLSVFGPSSSTRWWPVGLFFVSNIMHYMAVVPVCTTYLSEILPYRGRGITTGIVTAIFYLTIFVGTKTFPALDQHFGLHAIFFSYAVGCVISAVFVLFVLPETDGRFLSDIEIDLTRANCKKASNDRSMYNDRSRSKSIFRKFSSLKS